MNKLAYVAIALLVTLQGGFAFWAACPGYTPPRQIISSDCTDTRCTVTRGGMLVAESYILAESQVSHNHLEVGFSTTFLGVRFNFTLEEAHRNACTQLRGASCPTVPGTEYIWDINAPINPIYPPMPDVVVRGNLLMFVFAQWKDF